MAAVMKTEVERKAATKEKGLTALPAMTVGMLAGGTTSLIVQEEQGGRLQLLL